MTIHATISPNTISIGDTDGYPMGRVRAYIAFFMTFALMLSDYLSRQVISSVFPILKTEWGLSDTQLGSLVSVVALTVGVLSFPISLLADYLGRVRSIAGMAIVWGVATVCCGLSGNFIALLVCRAFIGVGEAGYGGVGAAVLIRVFPSRTHGSVMGGFLSAALFGSVLGVILGGILSKRIGWQLTFIVIGALGVLLALIFPMLVKEPKEQIRKAEEKESLRKILAKIFHNKTTVLTYVATGLAAFIQGSMLAWAPSYLNRYYHFDPQKSALGAALVVFAIGAGMIIFGNLTDRLSINKPSNRLWISMAYCLCSSITLLIAFSITVGTLQIVMVCLGAFLAGGATGPSAAVIADTTPSKLHGSALSILSLSISLLGFAPGPFITGMLADKLGLQTAMQFIPLISIAAAGIYFLAAKNYISSRK